ncbi:MAG TPA: hypothetical protein VKN36_08095 [Eudoraea sp.]|nr:hypothetical protein [Eudoraea sp.]
MLKTIDRLMQFIKYAGLSARQFDISIGAGNGYTLRMKKNNASIGSDVIENIIKTYPQLNVVWLLTGEGNMLKQEEEPELLDFDQLPKEKQKEIEQIIEKKIRERQEEELQRLLKEVTEEIEQTQKKMRDKDQR